MVASAYRQDPVEEAAVENALALEFWLVKFATCLMVSTTVRDVTGFDIDTHIHGIRKAEFDNRNNNDAAIVHMISAMARSRTCHARGF